MQASPSPPATTSPRHPRRLALAGGHGAVDPDAAIDDMVAFADAGITTFDCADIYTGVEEMIGRFRLRYRDLRGQEALDRIRVHTKFVPDLAVLPTISKAYVEASSTPRSSASISNGLISCSFTGGLTTSTAGSRRQAG